VFSRENMPTDPMKYTFIIAGMFVVSILLGCHNKHTGSVASPIADSFRDNAKRKRVGISEIETNWFLYRREFGAEDWKETSESKFPRKRIQRDKENILHWEEDYYYSGRTYITENGGISHESITMHYDYRTLQMSIHYIGPDAVLRNEFSQANLPQADEQKRLLLLNSTLSTWGFPKKEVNPTRQP
jgi:hypothetical protein